MVKGGFALASKVSRSDQPCVRKLARSRTAGSRELLHRILLATDGTVTTILEAYAGEPIEAVRLAQSRRPTAPHQAELLDVSAGSPVLDRHVLLRGACSETTFLYGESLIVPERMDAGIVDRLTSTNEPIGALLREHRLETFREVLTVGSEPAGTYGPHFGSDEDAVLLFRTYRVLARAQPIALITEKVLADAEEPDSP